MRTQQFKLFCPQNDEKKTQIFIRNTKKFHPELPNWPIKKNSCSKMWLIDQLYTYMTGGMAINKFTMSVCMLRVKLAGIGLQVKNYPCIP